MTQEKDIPRFDQWASSDEGLAQAIKVAEDDVRTKKAHMDTAGARLEIAKTPPRFDQWAASTTAVTRLPLHKSRISRPEVKKPTAPQATDVYGRPVATGLIRGIIEHPQFGAQSDAQFRQALAQVQEEVHPKSRKGAAAALAKSSSIGLIIDPGNINQQVIAGRVLNKLSPGFAQTEEELINAEAAKRVEAQERTASQEVTTSRKAFGKLPSALRTYAAPTARFWGGAGRKLSTVISGFGVFPNTASEYLEHKAEVLSQGASLSPLDAEGKEIERGGFDIPLPTKNLPSLPANLHVPAEKIGAAALDMGYMVAEIVALKKATMTTANPGGWSLGRILATEAFLNTPELPAGQRAQEITHAYTMGSVLDMHWGRLTTAGIFGGTTGLQTGTNYLQGKTTGEDAALQTLMQGAFGYIMGSKQAKPTEAMPEPPKKLLGPHENFNALRQQAVNRLQKQLKVEKRRPALLDVTNPEAVSTRIAELNSGIERIQSELATAQKAKGTTGRIKGLQQTLVKRMAVMEHERNALLDPKLQKTFEGRTGVADVFDARQARKAGVLPEPPTDVQRAELNPEVWKGEESVPNTTARQRNADQIKADMIRQFEVLKAKGSKKTAAEKTQMGEIRRQLAESAGKRTAAKWADQGGFINLSEIAAALRALKAKLPDLSDTELRGILQKQRPELFHSVESGGVRFIGDGINWYRGHIAEDTKVSNGTVKRELDRKAKAAPNPTIVSTPITPKPVAVPTTAPKPIATDDIGVLSFPQTLEEAGHTGGSVKTYDIKHNPQTVVYANSVIRTKGLDLAVAELGNRTEGFTAEDVAIGSRAIQMYEQQGRIDKAVDVADLLSQRLRNAGQTSQAASLITRLSPDGILSYAARHLPKGTKLTEQQAKDLVSKAREAQRTEKVVDSRDTTVQDLQQVAKDLKDPVRKATARTAPLLKRLLEKGDMSNPATVGAAKLAKSGMGVEKWKTEMIAQFGEPIRSQLNDIYRESFKLYDAERKQMRQDQLLKSAMKRGATPETVQQEIYKMLDEVTARRRARDELRNLFNDLELTKWQRRARTAFDVAGIPHAIMTSWDLSFGLRQGKPVITSHPQIWAEAMARQVKALSNTEFERMVSELEADPDFGYAQRYGLDLTSLSLNSGGTSMRDLASRSEGFQTTMADKIPGVKRSEQAYSTAGDWIRMPWFKDYIAKARRAGLDPDNPEHASHFQYGAKTINMLTGRGDLGRLNQIAPILNRALFSSRFWASRVQMLKLPLDPRTYTKMPVQARREAMKTLMGFYALVGAQLLLAKSTGATVGTDPDKADFGQANWGPLHVDFSAGLRGHLRFAAHLTKAIGEQTIQGHKRPPHQQPLDVLGTYVRTKEAPLVSLAHDTLAGEDVTGQPSYLLGDPKRRPVGRFLSSAIVKRFSPIVLQDAKQAFELMKPGAAVMVIPLAVAGEGVQVYGGQKQLGPTAAKPRKSARTPAHP